MSEMAATARGLDRRAMRKVVIGSFAGALLEWYDFFIYGTASAIVFAKVFFPTVDPLAGVVASFATFGAGFFARPLGGLVFGHFGDRVGRKSALVWTLLIIGAATFAIGLLPTYGQVGVAAPILLVVLRLLQGFGLGGEYGGAALLTIESAPKAKRGFYGSLPQTAASAGIMLATGVFAVLTSTLSEADFLAWGWRIPFLISLILLGVGTFIRLHTEEPVEFVQAREAARIEASQAARKERAPIIQAFRDHPKNLLLAFGARLAETVSSNIVNAFAIAYLSTQLAMDRSVPLNGMLVASAIGIAACPLFGWISDKVGQKVVYIAGAGFICAFAYPFFLMLNTQDSAVVWVALILAYNLGPTLMFSVQPTMFASMFGPRVRYTGLSFAYQFSAILGGLTPLIASSLLAAWQGAPWGVAAFLAAIAALSLISVVLVRGRSGR
ncbi:MAG: MHS family MFS transporter [Propionibacteriaceae bacterium]|jgi:MHS family shikimate/dehydroshikimate transporter-like MFS transporter|nr:MHS family MFS transporter [Propionibacteriaceae bacterium]